MLDRPTPRMSFLGSGNEHVETSFGTKKAVVESNQGARIKGEEEARLNPGLAG